MEPKGHDWYAELKDKYGVSCCNGEDCKPTAMCRLPNGREGIVVLGTCRLIPGTRSLASRRPAGVLTCAPWRRETAAECWCCVSSSAVASRRSARLI